MISDWRDVIILCAFMGHRVIEIYTLKMRSSGAVLGSSGVTEERLAFVVCMIKPGDTRRTWQDMAILYARSGWRTA